MLTGRFSLMVGLGYYAWQLLIVSGFVVFETRRVADVLCVPLPS